MSRRALRKPYEKILSYALIGILAVMFVVIMVESKNSGVWTEYNGYFKQSVDGDAVIYKDSVGHMIIRITSDGGDDKKDIVVENEHEMSNLKAEIGSNGTYKNVKIVDINGETIWQQSYSAKEDASIGNGHEEELPIDSDALCKMVTGEAGTKMNGKKLELGLSLFIMIVGIAVIELKNAIIMLDKIVVGMFYENFKELHSTFLLELAITLLGVILYCIGIVDGISFIIA